MHLTKGEGAAQEFRRTRFLCREIEADVNDIFNLMALLNAKVSTPSLRAGSKHIGVECK